MGVNVLGGGVSATDGVVGLAALETGVFAGSLLDLALGSGTVEVLVDVLELVVSLGLVNQLALAAGADLSIATTVRSGVLAAEGTGVALDQIAAALAAVVLLNRNGVNVEHEACHGENE